MAEIRAAGGQVFVFSSEPQDYVDAAKRKWGLPGLQMFGDTHSSLARHLRSAGLCAVHVSHPTDDAWTGGHPFMRYYTNGIAQPAVVVVDAEGKPLYAQATRPALANGGGAGDRADLAQVWAAVRPRAAGAPPPRPVRVRRLSELSPAATFALLAAPALIAAVIVSLYRRGARVVAVALAAAFLVVVRAGVRRNMALR